MNQSFTPNFTTQSTGVGTAQPNTIPQQNLSNSNQNTTPNADQNFNTTEAVLKSLLNITQTKTDSVNKPKLQTFSGDMEKAIEWYNHLRMIASHYRWTEEQMVKQARLSLTGEAESWYKINFIPPTDLDLTPYVTDPIPTWVEFSEAFLEEYRPKGSKMMLKQKLAELTRSKEETYVGFGRRVRCLAREIDPRMPEEELGHLYDQCFQERPAALYYKIY